MDFSYTTPNGVYRYVANADREGYDREVPVEYGDSVSFDFAAYLFSSSIGALYYTNVKEWIPAKDLEVLNPAIEGNQTLQREAIRRESRIELATEGQRYFDVRRWMIADKAPGQGGQGGEFHGMNVDQPQPAYYTRTKLQTRSFKNKNYLYPIPLDEIKRSDVLVQNPGW